jgi:hypothetical protein
MHLFTGTIIVMGHFTETADRPDASLVLYPDELPEHKDRVISLNGRCEAVRQLGGMTFLRVASHYFSLQVIVLDAALRDATAQIRQADIISVSGRLRIRPDVLKESVDPRTHPNQYEVVLEQFSILLPAQKIDFVPSSKAKNHHFHRHRRHQNSQLVALIKLHLERQGFVQLPPPASLGFHEQQRVRELVALCDSSECDSPLFSAYTTEQLMFGTQRFYFFIDGAGNLPDLLHVVIAHHQCGPDGYEGILSAIARQVVELLAPDTPWRLDAARPHWPALMLQTQPSMHITGHTGDRQSLEPSGQWAAGQRIAMRRRLKSALPPLDDMASTLSVSLDALRQNLEAACPPKRGKVLAQELQPGSQPEHAESYEAYSKLESEHQMLLVEQSLQGFNPSQHIATARTSAQAALRYMEPALDHYGIDPGMAQRFLSLQAQLHPDSSGPACPVELFQLLWTVLGNPSAKRLLDSNAHRDRLLAVFVDQRILTDVRQLVFIHPGAIDALGSLFEHIRDKDTLGRLRTLLRSVIARTPTELATLLTTLGAMSPADAIAAIAQTKKLENAVKHGLTTPYWLSRCLDCDDPSSLVNELYLNNLKASQRVLGNHPLLPSSTGNEGDTQPSLAETIYTLFRPITAGISDLQQTLCELRDHCGHVERAGLKRFNRGFVPHLQGYRYFINQERKPYDRLRIYLSKNAASFFAKSTTGICTDINRGLFERDDHFHLNIFSERRGRLVGNVQLYTLTIGNEPALLIRGINPIKHYATNALVDELLDCIIACATDLAAENAYAMVCVAHQNGLWNSNSNRPELRAALARRLAHTEPLTLDHPFHLYTYYRTPIYLSDVYPLWRSTAQTQKLSI